MGAKMDKASVIYGQGNGVPVGKMNWTALQEAVTAEIGPEPIPGLPAAKKAVEEAKTDKNLENAYVKVGLVSSDLVLRIKDKRTLLDKEIDTTLLKGYKGKKEGYVKSLDQGTELDKGQVDPKLVKQMVAQINESMDSYLLNPSAIAEAKQALEKNNLMLARSKIGGLGGKLRVAMARLTRVDTVIALTCKNFNWNPRHVDPGVFRGRRAKLLTALKKDEVVVEKMEEVLERLELNAPPPVSTNGQADEQYRQKFERSLRANTAIIEKLKSYFQQATVLSTKGLKAADLGGGVKTAAEAGNVAKMAAQVDQQYRVVYQSAVKDQLPMRHRLGDSNVETMTVDDKTNVFVPLNSRSMNLMSRIVGRGTAMQVALAPVLEGYAERFPELRTAVTDVLNRLTAPLAEGN